MKTNVFYIKTIMSENKDLTIFINTHVDFEAPVSSDTYCVVSSNDSYTGPLKHYKAELPWILNDSFYSELYMMTWVARNIELPKYVGFCHYRRYFSFLDEIPDMSAVFSDSEILLPKPVENDITNYEFYALCHNHKDMDLIGQIIHGLYPSYGKFFSMFCQGKSMFPCNMFIMESKMFLKYMLFIHDILNEYIKIKGMDFEKVVEENKEDYLKEFAPNNSVGYQKRIGGFLAERLTNVFVLGNFNNATVYDLVITEDKYNEGINGTQEEDNTQEEAKEE